MAGGDTRGRPCTRQEAEAADGVYGILMIVAGVLFCLLLLCWMYRAVVKLTLWKEAEKKCVAMRSGLLDNQVYAGHDQGREVVLQVQVVERQGGGEYLNMKGFDELHAETNGALTRNQYDVICFVVKHQASRGAAACSLSLTALMLFCIVVVPIIYYGVWLIITRPTGASATQSQDLDYEDGVRAGYLLFAFCSALGSWCCKGRDAGRQKWSKDVLAELNAKVSSAQLSFHDVDDKFVVRDAVVMGEPVDVQPATTQESDSHINNRNELEIAIC